MLIDDHRAMASYLLAGFITLPVHAATCSILVYHRFGPLPADSMTTTTSVFRQQITQLREHGYQIMPLSALMDTLQARQQPQQNIVAITVYDAHRSVYEDLLPVIKELNIPVSLFIYPSAIGHADYALTWAQLRRLVASQRIEIGSHTYWHPDFRRERQHLNPAAFATFLASQLDRSKSALREQLDIDARFLAWPYGISDNQLEQQAQRSGYAAALGLGNRNASSDDRMYALPRHMIVDQVGVSGLLRRLHNGPDCTP